MTNPPTSPSDHLRTFLYWFELWNGVGLTMSIKAMHDYFPVNSVIQKSINLSSKFEVSLGQLSAFVKVFWIIIINLNISMISPQGWWWGERKTRTWQRCCQWTKISSEQHSPAPSLASSLSTWQIKKSLTASQTSHMILASSPSPGRCSWWSWRQSRPRPVSWTWGRS